MKYVRLMCFLIVSSALYWSCSDQSENPVHKTSIYKGSYQKLIESAEKENLNAIKKIVANNHLNLNYADPIYGLSILNWCIINRKYESYKQMLKLGADPNWQDPNGRFAPAITEAAKVDYTSDYLKLALEHNGDCNLLSKKISGILNQTPLLGAIYSKRIESIQLLLNRGADVNLTHDSLWTPLAETLVQGKIEMAKYLIEKGADYKNLKFKTVSVVTDSKGNQILDSNGSLVIRYDSELSILDLLRQLEFPLNSNEHNIKMEVVNLLKVGGLDYWSHPIPPKIKTRHKSDPDYLLKY